MVGSGANTDGGAWRAHRGFTGAYILCSSVAVVWVGFAFIHPAPRVPWGYDSLARSGYGSRTAQLAFFLVSLRAAFLVTRGCQESRWGRCLALGIIGTATALHADVPWFVSLNESFWKFAWAAVLLGSAITYIRGISGVVPESRKPRLLEYGGSDRVAWLLVGVAIIGVGLVVWRGEPELAVPVVG